MKKRVEFPEIQPVLHEGVDPALPLIYVWRILVPGADPYYYVGKSDGGHARPGPHYRTVVTKYLNGEPKRKDDPLYREVQWRLGEAFLAGHDIALAYVENVPDGVRSKIRERAWAVRFGVSMRAAKGSRRPARIMPEHCCAEDSGVINFAARLYSLVLVAHAEPDDAVGEEQSAVIGQAAAKARSDLDSFGLLIRGPPWTRPVHRCRESQVRNRRAPACIAIVQ